MKEKKVVWIINQFANTPEFPGHTRQYDLAIGLAKKGWKVKVARSGYYKIGKGSFIKNMGPISAYRLVPVMKFEFGIISKGKIDPIFTGIKGQG